ncbi:MAG: hypothetical protein GF329_06100 [Candidatus Lokiarchaeota archaeon]|nr:hypothetical protein [Candidatus Lokiarchaeota archaeon]
MNLVDSNQLNEIISQINELVSCKGSVITDQQGLVIASDNDSEIDENVLALSAVCDRKNLNQDKNSVCVHSKISNDASLALCLPKHYNKKELMRSLSIFSHKLADIFSGNFNISRDFFQLLKISNPTPEFMYNRPCARSDCESQMEVTIQFGQHTANRQYYMREEHFCPTCGYRKKDKFRITKKLLSILTT